MNVLATGVVLSRRNLRTLLAMLDDPEHVSKSIGKSYNGAFVTVTAEEDATHYSARTPGTMGPRIEAALSLVPVFTVSVDPKAFDL